MYDSFPHLSLTVKFDYSHYISRKSTCTFVHLTLFFIGGRNINFCGTSFNLKSSLLPMCSRQLSKPHSIPHNTTPRFTTPNHPLPYKNKPRYTTPHHTTPHHTPTYPNLQLFLKIRELTNC